MPRKVAAPTPLGNHIIRRRRMRGWTTADLARESELSYSTVRNIEKGSSHKPEEWVLRAIVRALDCNESVVFGLAGYGDIPQRTPEDVTVGLDELGDEAPAWRAAIDQVKQTMTPDEQRQALIVLQAQLAAARLRHH